MAISSIHINPVKANSEIHNKRLKEYDYVRKDLTPLNESWEAESISNARKRINKAYKESTGQRIQKTATPIREGVVNLNPDNTMEDLHNLSEKLYNAFGIKTIQIHIHRDEGHAKSKEWKQNLHAHMVFDWTDELGKTLKLNMHDMSKFQDIVADTLRMERGQKSDKKHLSSIAYKVQEIEKDIEKLQKEVAHYINITTPDNLDNYVEKSLFGKKIKEDKIQELIRSEKAKGAIIAGLKEKTDKIVKSYQKELQELERKNKELERLKNDYTAKSQQIAAQMQELEELREKKSEYEQIKPKYDKIKKYEGLTNSKRYIQESIQVREIYEEKMAKIVLTQLVEEKSWKSKKELYNAFCEGLKKYGFKEDWEENPFFEEMEENLNIQYSRGRGIGI